MKNLKGANYRKEMDRVTPELVSGANRIKEATNKFTSRNILELAVKFDLPPKTTCEFLEYAGFLPSGTWERFSLATKRLLRKTYWELKNDWDTKF